MSVMEVCCPNCATRFPLIAGMNDADARRVAGLMGSVPPKLAPLLLEYLAMFKPPKSGLTWGRTHKLLAEVTACVVNAEVMRNGVVWPAPVEAWQAALQEMIDRRHKFVLPLKNHGYLFEILAGAAEKVSNRQEQTGRRPSRETADTRQTGRRPGEIKSELNHFKNLLESSPSATTRDYLQGQVDKLEAELAGVRGMEDN